MSAPLKQRFRALCLWNEC